MWKKSLTLFVVLLLAGCTQQEISPTLVPTPTLEDQFLDRSLITGEPCEAPCWYGLEAGLSTKAEVLTVVSSLTFIDPEKIFEEPSSYRDQLNQENLPSTALDLRCQLPKHTICARMEFVGDELRRIYLFPNYQLSLQEVVEYLGSPDYVQRLTMREPRGECDITLEWSQRLIKVFSRSTKENPIQCTSVSQENGINPNLPVHVIVYMVPGNSILISTPDSWGDFPWVGFMDP